MTTLNTRTTPWGSAQTVREESEGIVFYTTASHGGYYLSPERFAEFRVLFPDYPLWAGDPWFEEDCDATLIYIAFAQHFTDEQVFYAEQMLQACLRNEKKESGPWLRVWTTCTHNEQLAAVLQRAAKFRLEHQDEWQRGSMGTNGNGWNVWMTRLRDGAEHVKFFPSYPEKNFYTESEMFASC